MTQKEKLYIEMATLNNELINVYGDKCPSSIKTIDIEHETRCRRYNNWRVDELKSRIENLKRTKSDLDHKMDVERFFTTEKGSIMKKYLDAEIAKTEKEIENVFTKYQEKLENIVKDICGDGYIIKSFSNTSFSVNKKDENGNAKFGYGWDLYRDAYNKVVMNYGTMGSFNPMENPDKVDYLMKMANFAKKENFAVVVCWFNDFYFELEENRRYLNNVKDQLNDPMKYAKTN